VIEVEQFTPVCTSHGEGPIWDGNIRALRCVDMLAGDVLTFDGSGTATRQRVGSVAATIRPRASGGLVIGTERGFALADPDGTLRAQPDLWGDTTVRMNEGGCDPQGRFYCGSMAYDEAPGRGTLYRFDPDGSTAVVLEGLTVSNGLAWTPAGDAVYHADSPTGLVSRFAFDSASGAFVHGTPFVEIDPADGLPDGLTVDAAGDVWVALWRGAAVRHYSSGGDLMDVLELPVPLVTACTFGGDDLGDLFITTSRMGVADGDQPQAGALFRCRPGASGRPAATFAG
jgi:sugar lactone lactonase YvrE